MSNNYTAYEEFTLPSEGKIYEEEVSPTVKLRSMTTNEEMKRLSKSDRPYKIYADIIDACIVEPIGISSYDLCLGDFEFLMHKLRIVTYGPEYPLQCVCPTCYTHSEEAISLNDFQVKTDFDTIEECATIELPVSKQKVSLKMQTPRMLDQEKLEADRFKRSLKDKSIGDTDTIFIIKGLINLIDGQKPDPITFNDWIRNLPMRDTLYIIQKAKKLNDSIGLDTELEVVCDVCGTTYKSPFRFDSEFFRPQLLE